MSVQNFVPELWSAKLLLANQKNQVFRKVCNSNYQGEINQKGDRVKVNSLGAITVDDYDKSSTTITYSDLTSASQWVVLDQANYWSVQVHDADAAQSNIDLMNAAIADASYRMSDKADQFIAAFYSQAGCATSSANVNSENVLETIAEAGRRLTDEHCPTQGRWMVVPPWFLLKLQLAFISNSVVSEKPLIDGSVTRVLGFDILVSPNIKTSSTTNYIMAGTMEAMTYVEGIVKVEAMRLEGKFADGIRGLQVYGGQVVKGDCLCSVPCVETAEA